MTSIRDLVIDCAVAYVVIKSIQYYGRIKYAEGRHDEKLGKKVNNGNRVVEIVINKKGEEK